MENSQSQAKPHTAEIKEYVDRIRESLPKVLEVASLGVKSKAPWNLLCTREALIWRIEELARNAHHALERDDVAVAAILTRAVTESAALTWKLMDVLETRKQYTDEEFYETLMRMLVGGRKWEDMPQAFQILTSIDRMNKKVPGVRPAYDSLSEFAHPNWAGAFGLYSMTDETAFTTYFGRALRGSEANHDMVANALLGSLGCFEYAYNKISEMMPRFLAELESLWPEDAAPS